MCVRVCCVCVCVGGGICVFERETEIDRDRKKERKPRRQREREFFFFSGRKNSHRYMFQLPQKKDPMQKHFFEYSSLICTFLKEQGVQGSPVTCLSPLLCWGCGPSPSTPVDAASRNGGEPSVFLPFLYQWVGTMGISGLMQGPQGRAGSGQCETSPGSSEQRRMNLFTKQK